MTGGKYKNLYRIDSNRLKGYDYSFAGGYFLTICTCGKECLFGEIKNCEMELNEFGLIVKDEWEKSGQIRREIILDEFIVMPNHLHVIVFINNNNKIVDGTNGHAIVGKNGHSVETNGRSSLRHINERVQTTGRSSERQRPRMRVKSISSLMAGFKSATAKQINIIRHTPNEPVWQNNYYDHIIRNEQELNKIRQYIIDNPLKWEIDRNNPENLLM